MTSSPLNDSPTSAEAPIVASFSTSLDHLTFPELVEAPSPPAPVEVPQHRQLLKDRLYVGNLHPSVDEYTLIQVFSKFGKIAKMDFLFHKTGALKGKPRGYAFVEYAEPANAAVAFERANGKLLRGRKLVVTYAHQAPLDQAGDATSLEKRRRAAAAEINKPTTLSLIKSHGSGVRSNATADKIALMEAKLKELENRPDDASTSSATPAHPSLPRKPPPTVPQAATPNTNTRPSTSGSASISRSSTSMPGIMPSLPKSAPTQSNSLQLRALGSSTTQIASKKGTKLSGVRINKAPKPS